MHRIAYVTLIVTIATPLATQAQISNGNEGSLRIPDSAHVQMLYLNDGTTLVGRITEVTDDDVTFETDIGLMTIAKTKIREIKEVDVSSFKGGVYWFPSPNYTRLFFAPTARPLKKGDGYFADYLLFFPMVAYGLTDNVTIAGGMSIVPITDFFRYNLYYFAPKIGFEPTRTLALSAGMFLIKLPSFGDDVLPTVGMTYGLTTVGNLNASLTGGLGFGFVDWEFSSKPFWLIGGESRVSRNYSLVTENWFVPGLDDPFVSYGLRFMGEKLSADLIFWNDLGGDVRFPGWPMIDFVFKF